MPASLSYNCLVVLGPTASGKTALACALAAELQGEIISADSRQVYRDLNIGTGKDLDAYEVNGLQIPCHLIDVADPAGQFYLHDFERKLREAFFEIRNRSKLPVICGGTGLYLDALRKSHALTDIPEDPTLRTQLESLDKRSLLHRLSSYPAKFTEAVDKTSVKRMIRGIEIAEYLKHHAPPRPRSLPYMPYYIGIRLPKEELHDRIAKRLRHRLAHGMIEEAERLLSAGIGHEKLRRFGLEYKFLSLYLNGEIPLAEMQDKLCTAIRQYAKRQMTWFRKMEKEGVFIDWQHGAEPSPELIMKLKAVFSAAPSR